jgi:hypothetical protein
MDDHAIAAGAVTMMDMRHTVTSAGVAPARAVVVDVFHPAVARIAMVMDHTPIAATVIDVLRPAAATVMVHNTVLVVMVDVSLATVNDVVIAIMHDHPIGPIVVDDHAVRAVVMDDHAILDHPVGAVDVDRPIAVAVDNHRAARPSAMLDHRLGIRLADFEERLAVVDPFEVQPGKAAPVAAEDQSRSGGQPRGQLSHLLAPRIDHAELVQFLGRLGGDVVQADMQVRPRWAGVGHHRLRRAFVR